MNLENWPNRWITADWHLGEYRMDLMMRPFSDAEEHVNHLIKEHNKLVAPDDLVIVVGDVVNKDTPHYLRYVDNFNGKKILIRGNHERNLSNEELSKYFDLIILEGDGLELSVGELDCWATHYPSQARIDKFNLVGHVHYAWKVQLNSLNVGVDCNHFAPHNLDKSIPFVYGAICQYFDKDVWAAYHPANKIWASPGILNQQFRGSRGKENSYFNDEINLDQLPELAPEERMLLDSLGKDFVKNLLKNFLSEEKE